MDLGLWKWALGFIFIIVPPQPNSILSIWATPSGYLHQHWRRERLQHRRQNGERSRGGGSAATRRCSRQGGWCECSPGRGGWWRLVRWASTSPTRYTQREGAGRGGTRAWKVVKLPRPPTNASLMKTVGAMAGMRRRMVEATCMLGPHVCRRAAWGVLVEMGMVVRERKGGKYTWVWDGRDIGDAAD